MSMETKKFKRKPLMGHMSKNHPIKSVKVDQNTLKSAVQRARENERNWYRIQEEEDSGYKYDNNNNFYNVLY